MVWVNRCEEIVLPPKWNKISREPNQSVMKMARNYWLTMPSRQWWVLEAQEATFERIWWSFLPHDLWSKSKPVSLWKHAIMLVCFLLCSVAFVIRKKEWHFSSWCALWMAALCRTALTFSILCRLNASHFFRASIAPGKCDAMEKHRLLKRQSSVIHCPAPQNMKDIILMQLSKEWLQWKWAEGEKLWDPGFSETFHAEQCG